MHITVFLQFFLSHKTEKLREEPSNVSESFKCQVSKKFMQLNGMSLFSVENFPSQCAERFRCGTLWYIRKKRLSKNFMPMRLISLFSVEFFSRILPIKFVGEPLFVSESLGHRKFLCSVGGGGASRFAVVFFGLPVLETFVGTASTLGNFRESKLSMHENGKSRFFRRNFFVSQYHKNSW